MNRLIGSMIRRSGRSWWQVRYIDGKVLSEWETLQSSVKLPIGAGNSSRWEEINKFGIVGIRLLCPNGIAAELEGKLGTQFIQLKTGGIDVALGSSIKGVRRYCDAHIIGAILDADGNCFCRAWETKEKKLIQFNDNIYNMKYRNIGALNLGVQSIRA